MKTLRLLTPLFICAGVLQCVSSCVPHGQMLLRMDVIQGREVILATQFDVDDHSSVSEIWDAASEVPVHAEVIKPSLNPSQDSPLKLELTGPVEIRITHVTSVQTRATMTGLTLIRSSPTTTDWRLPTEEVDRAKKAAGL
jgi:hypothetical protein